MMAQNIQILLETMIRCGGNCSGCALSSSERMSKSNIDWNFFWLKVDAVNKILKEKIKREEIESVSLFLGQGDHFLMSEKDIDRFMAYCSTIVPKEISHKTVILITASAIGKYLTTKEKMDKFFNLSLKYGMPFFIQVVFDPKKGKLKVPFQKTYMDNILYFKEKCGMTEVTLNLGNDLFENLTPSEFHNWVLKYNFIHVEMNWVMNNQTYPMWKKYSQVMFDWLKELLEINAKDHKYEINFVPFLARAFNYLNANKYELIQNIFEGLYENIYIDNNGNIAFGQAGLVSNLIPFGERLEKKETTIFTLDQLEQTAQKNAKNILSKLLRKQSCMNCKYSNVCAQIGSVAWFDFENDYQDCPWNIKGFLTFVEIYLNKYPQFKDTKFDKNPIQDKVLEKENNAMFTYFENKVKDVCDVDYSQIEIKRN